MEPVWPDAAIATLVETVTNTLIIEAYKNNWFDNAGSIVLPSLPKIGEDEEYKAGSTELMAICWGRWRRTEQRRRFLGGSFEHYAPPQLPAWVTKGTRQVTTYK